MSFSFGCYKSPVAPAPVELQCVITKRIENGGSQGWDYNIIVRLVDVQEIRAVSGNVNVVDEDRARVLVYMKMIEMMGTWLADLAPAPVAVDYTR